MSTREDFEAWAISVQLSTTKYEGLGGYAFYETRKALESWQAATSRQEAKIKALVEALGRMTADTQSLAYSGSSLEYLNGYEYGFDSAKDKAIAAAAKETP